MGHLWAKYEAIWAMGHFWGTSEAIWGTFGALRGDLWCTLGGHVRHIGGPMGHLWITSEDLWGTYGAPLGNI